MKLDSIESGFVWDVEYINPDGSFGWRERLKNLIPIEGLNHLASVAFSGGTQVPTWYIAPFEGNYTPVAAATAATIAAAATECTTYDETARVVWNESAPNNGSVDNTANKAQFTFNAAKTIYGAFLVSASPKGATTGVLMSLVRFPTPKQTDIGGVLRIVTGIAFAST